MANLSEDIQCAGSDTRPPMLDRTDFASWQQRIRLYCRGKDNGVNILKSIDEGPYKLGTFRETLAESTEGTPQFGPERSHVYSDLNSVERDRYNADIRATNILLQGLPKDIYTLINHYTDAKDIWDNVKMLLEGSELTKEDREFSKIINDMRNIKMTMPKLQLNSKFVNNMLPEWGRFVTAVKLNRGLRESNYDQLYAYLKQHEAHAKENKMGGNAAGYGEAQNRARNVNQGQARPGQARTVKCYNCNGTGHIARNCTQPKRPQNFEYFKDKMLLMQAQENEDLALNVDNVFQAEDCDAFHSDVDEAPTAQTMFMANLSLVDLISDEAGLSYDLDILSEVRDHDQYLDDTCAYQEEHVMHDSVQLDHVVDLHADHTCISNMIPYDQYVKDIDVSVVHSNASSVPNDTFMMIYDDMCEPIAPSVSDSSWNAVVKNSLTIELATYREQVELYERRAKFELTEREQKINEQLKLVISDHNHARAKVHNSEDTLEIAELTRKKMNDKMTDPECVTHKLRSYLMITRKRIS
nr:integrase, catalytic region, zinc finger, CCHC-type, peptidase aspartic, catalytic [Tanacetum cinerariifolium]